MSDLAFKDAGDGSYTCVNGGVRIATARVRDNYICELWVHPAFRRQKIATNLIAFIAAARGQKLNRAPSAIKNRAVRALSEKLGDALLGEAPR